MLSVTRQKKQFLYKEGENFNFMDMNSYEQIAVPQSLLGKMVNFLKENLEVEAIYLENEIIGIDLPIIIEMTIAETERELKAILFPIRQKQLNLRPAQISTYLFSLKKATK